MPSFTYVARESGTGREIRSSLEAQTEQAAIAALLNRNLLVVPIQEKMSRKGKTAGGKVGLADLERLGLDRLFHRRRLRVSTAGAGRGSLPAPALSPYLTAAAASTIPAP